ncbi:2-oxo-hepta-3-ene-1,7-dioic acid hydratase [soil metagenome]
MDERVERGMAAQLARRQEQLTAGEEPIGWKIGLNPPAAQEKAGISAPVTGFLTDATVLASGGRYTIDGADVSVEPEVAVRLGTDLDAGADAGAGAAAIASLAPALEVVDLDRDVSEIEAVLAGNVFHRAVVFGDELEGAHSLAGLGFRVLRGSEPEAEGDVVEAAGHLDTLLLGVARFLDAHGAALRAGDRVICGSLVVPPLAAHPGETIALELGPLGRVEVGFDA